MAAFKEAKGVDVAVSRLMRELEYLNTNAGSASDSQSVGSITSSSSRGKRAGASGASTPSSSSSSRRSHLHDASEAVQITSIENPNILLIQQLFGLFSLYIATATREGGDGGIIRGPHLMRILEVVFSNPALTGDVIGHAINQVADIISNDPAPPSMLTYFAQSGVARKALLAACNERIEYNETMLVSVCNLISNLSLTSEGQKLVQDVGRSSGGQENSLFRFLISLFYDKKYYPPHSKLFGGDNASVCGQSFEELLRHHPVYQADVVDAIVYNLQQANQKYGTMNDLERCGDWHSCVELWHQTASLLNVLEPIMSRKAAASLFLECGGMGLLLSVATIAFGSPRYLLLLPFDGF
jgi:hypothetical protein